jgi:bifunctional DNA-binding transcriptional regulator/antitoxin component of YhaV-PrlF toxin-antitoxin module
VTDELSWEVIVDRKGRIEIPREYVEMSGIPEGESFSIKLGRENIHLESEGMSSIDWYGVYEKREEDELLYLTYLTVCQNGTHIIPEQYTDLIGASEGCKYEIRVGSKRIRLISTY